MILMYVENFGNPRRFLDIASRITRVKPIVVVKSGRSRVGARAASSHTGALAASDVAVDALLAQAGVLRAGSVEELFDLAMTFSGQPMPRSRRTAVLTNSGGPGILAADALEAQGVEVTELDPSTVATLKPLFPEEASIRNPVDMIATATPAGYRSALAALLADPKVDSAVAIFVPPLGIRQEDVAEAIGKAAATSGGKPVLAVLMGREGLPQGKAELHDVRIPAFIFPESAARALAAMCRYREWQERPLPSPETLAVDKPRATAILAGAKLAGQGRLSEIESLQLLAAYGIPTAGASLACDADEAARQAAAAGYPVVLKIVAPEIVHKTDVGGVRVDLADEHEVREAFNDIVARARAALPGAAISGVLVQSMVRGGVETFTGTTVDPSLGALVGFGLGGVFVEVLRDAVFRVAPINRLDAAEMVRGIRGFKMLTGLRGAPPVDLAALEEILIRVGRLAADFPEIAELDVNPLLAFADRAVAVDARVILS